MRLPFLLPFAALSTLGFAQAPVALPGSHSRAAVSGGTYKVDPGHTIVVWTLNHMGISPLTGMFGGASGSLTLDPKRPDKSTVTIDIPLSKVMTASAELTQHLLRPGKDGAKPDFFGANPGEARFVSTSVTAKGDHADIHGQLTLNGVTRPVLLNARFYGAGKMPQAMGGLESVGFQATGKITRSQFGLTTYIPLVSDEVDLNITAAFVKA